MMMPGAHKRPPRTGVGSRDIMMRDLIRVVGDQGTATCPEGKLLLMEGITQVPRPSGYRASRHCTPHRNPATGRSSVLSHRSRSVMSGSRMSHRLPKLSPRSAITTPFFETVPQSGRRSVPDRSPEFYEKMRNVDPKFLAMVHKNMQEKVYCRFKSTREAFRNFDSDHSGAIDVLEFQNMLHKLELCGPGDSGQVTALFHLCNESGNGQISYKEFCKWIKVPDRHDNLMVYREDPYIGEKGGMSFIHRSNWIRKFGVMCE